VLNRAPYSQLPDCDGQQLAEKKNRLNTLRVLMYMFPRQFGLHNVFTSKVDYTETAQRLKDYTLREKEISEKFGPLDTGVRLPKIPKRLRGEATALVQKLQILHSRCSYAKLLHHYCPVRILDSRHTV
jgi:telomerase reverse transcriptase